MMIIICYNCNLSLDCNIVLETKTKNISSSNIKFAIRFFLSSKKQTTFLFSYTSFMAYLLEVMSNTHSYNHNFENVLISNFPEVS